MAELRVEKGEGRAGRGAKKPVPYRCKRQAGYLGKEEYHPLSDSILMAVLSWHKRSTEITIVSPSDQSLHEPVPAAQF